MASPTHFDEDFDFGGGFSGTQSDTTGNKRPSPDYDDEDYDNDPFGKKKARTKAEEAASGVTTGMILSLRESLQNCKDTLAMCKNELEAAKSEIQKWCSSFQNEPFIPAGTIPGKKDSEKKHPELKYLTYKVYFFSALPSSSLLS